MNIYKNDRFYRWDEDELQEVRVIKINNEDSFTVEKVKGYDVGAVCKVPKKSLTDLYTRLNPDACLEFAVVKVTDKMEDVMVTLTKKDQPNEPFLVCRQNVVDLFAQVATGDNETKYTGICISRDNCPSELNFDDFLAYTDKVVSELVSYYLGDSLYDIFKILHYMDRYDATLRENFYKHIKHVSMNNKWIEDTYKKNDFMNGYCKSLVTLLELNNFEYDMNTVFGIISTDFDDSDFEGGVLSEEARHTLSNMIAIEIDKSLVVDYDKDVDLSKIKRNYRLVSDKNRKLHVVAFTGIKRSLAPKRYMSGDISIADTMRALDHVKFNTKKYD